MNAFLSGSRVYGVPREDILKPSDLDLLVLASVQDIAKLNGFQDGASGSGQGDWDSVRFGPLNIIATSDPKRFAVWKQITEDLQARKPVTKEEAVAHWELLEGAYDALRKGRA